MGLRHIKTTAAMLGLGAVLCWGGTARAEDPNAILDLLEHKGLITHEEAVEARKYYEKQMKNAVVKNDKMKVGSWIDVMKWSSDLRLRTEYFDNEDQTNPSDRWRFRYRLRLGIEAKFINWATVGLRLASGDASDPVSTNETLDDTFQKDPIQIDAAYAIIQPPGWDWVSVTGGKMNNPIYQPAFASPLVYDFDVTPEGVAERFVFRFGRDQRHSLFLNLGEFALNEISNSADTDGYLFDMQGGAEFKFGKNASQPVLRAKVVGGFLWTDNADVGSQQNDSPNVGNAVSIAGTTTNILADFEVVHVDGEIAWQVCEQPFLGTPAVITLSGEYVKNLADAFDTLSGASTNIAPDQTKGYTGQVTFGSNKKKGEWQVGYQYKYLEADAVYAELSDSDWGNGGTDRKGHVVKATYNFQDWWQLGLTAFITEKISNRTGANTVSAVNTKELLRVQIDSVWKF
jgi:Putative porin